MLTPTCESFPVALLLTVAVHVAEGAAVEETIVVEETGFVDDTVVGDETGFVEEIVVDAEAAPGRHWE